MAKQYSQEFKKNAVALLKELNKKGEVIIKGVKISNVRMLIQELGCSSYSLYGWKETYDFIDNIPEVDIADLDVDSDFFDSESEVSIESSGEKIEKKEMYMKLDNTFFMSLARGLGLKNYRTSEKQLWLMVGMELVKRSGLVDNDKIKRQLKQNGDNL